jgi:hypothetical protein
MVKQDDKQQIIKTTLRCPAELWKRVRMRAIKDGTTAEALVIAALSEYLKKGDR